MKLRAFLESRLMERATVSPAFARQVYARARKIASDIADDLPKGPAFIEKVQSILSQIYEYSWDGSVFSIRRAELRPSDMILTTVGCHWCWDDQQARVYHHDNATDDAEREGIDPDSLVEIILDAEASPRAVDWVFTCATNLILPGEREITIRNNAKVTLIDAFQNRPYKALPGKTPRQVLVSGYYDVI